MNEKGFSLVEVVVSLLIGCLMIEMLFTGFLFTKKQYIKANTQQEAVRYGREMTQYVREKMSVDGRVTSEDLKMYLKGRDQKMQDYTYSFIWVPLSSAAHVVEAVELEEALACSTDSHFDRTSIKEVLEIQTLYLKTSKQKGQSDSIQHYWLIGVVRKKEGKERYGGVQYFVTYQ